MVCPSSCQRIAKICLLLKTIWWDKDWICSGVGKKKWEMLKKWQRIVFTHDYYHIYVIFNNLTPKNQVFYVVWGHKRFLQYAYICIYAYIFRAYGSLKKLHFVIFNISCVCS